MSKQLAERNAIHALQDIMLEVPKDEQIDVEAMTSHHFAPGVYAREYFIPAGSLVVGTLPVAVSDAVLLLLTRLRL